MLVAYRQPAANRSLIQAAIGGDMDAALVALKAGANPDALDLMGRTALIRAALGNHIAVVRLLLKRGAAYNLPASNHSGLTPLLAAAQGGDPRLLILLIAHGANSSAVMLNGSSAVLLAIRAQQFDNAACLLEKNPALANRPDLAGDTPLLEAAAQGYQPLVKTLLNSCGKLSVGNKEGWTTLMKAAHGKHQGLVRWLLASGAQEIIERRNSEGWTALCMSIYAKDEHSIDALLEAGASPYVVTHAGSTPLMLAARTLNLSLMHRLLDLLPEELRQSTLNQASIQGGCTALEIFVSSARESLERNGLLLDLEQGYVRLVRRMAEMGADIEVVADHLGLHLADLEQGNIFEGAREAVVRHPNHSQTTHRAIVHRTAGKAGQLLKARHGGLLNLMDKERILENIRRFATGKPGQEGLLLWLDELKDHFLFRPNEAEAARGEVEKDEQDPASSLSLSDGLVLVWGALEDPCYAFTEAQRAKGRRELNLAGRMAWAEYAQEDEADDPDNIACFDGCYNALMDAASEARIPGIYVIQDAADLELRREWLQTELCPVEAAKALALFEPKRFKSFARDGEAFQRFMRAIAQKQRQYKRYGENAMHFEGDEKYNWDWFTPEALEGYHQALSWTPERVLREAHLEELLSLEREADTFISASQWEGLAQLYLENSKAGSLPLVRRQEEVSADCLETLAQIECLVFLTLGERNQLRNSLFFLEQEGARLAVQYPVQAELLEPCVFEVVRGQLIEQAIAEGAAQGNLNLQLEGRNALSWAKSLKDTLLIELLDGAGAKDEVAADPEPLFITQHSGQVQKRIGRSYSEGSCLEKGKNICPRGRIHSTSG